MTLDNFDSSFGRVLKKAIPATRGFSLKAPMRIKISPTKLLSPGRPREDIAKSRKKALKAGIQNARTVDGVVRISAGNYGGKLGRHKIFLRELFP
jgi:hypothetical protein